MGQRYCPQCGGECYGDGAVDDTARTQYYYFRACIWHGAYGSTIGEAGLNKLIVSALRSVAAAEELKRKREEQQP